MSPLPALAWAPEIDRGTWEGEYMACVYVLNVCARCFLPASSRLCVSLSLAAFSHHCPSAHPRTGALFSFLSSHTSSSSSTRLPAHTFSLHQQTHSHTHPHMYTHIYTHSHTYTHTDTLAHLLAGMPPTNAQERQQRLRCEALLWRLAHRAHGVAAAPTTTMPQAFTQLFYDGTTTSSSSASASSSSSSSPEEQEKEEAEKRRRRRMSLAALTLR